MKILKFLFFTIVVFILNFQAAFSDEETMKKGLEIFNEKAGCAGCHILKAAGAEGNIGPNLEQVNVSLESIKHIITNGQGVMPALGLDGTLSKEEIETVSYFVVNSVNN